MWYLFISSTNNPGSTHTHTHKRPLVWIICACIRVYFLSSFVCWSCLVLSAFWLVNWCCVYCPEQISIRPFSALFILLPISPPLPASTAARQPSAVCTKHLFVTGGDNRGSEAWRGWRRPYRRYSDWQHRMTVFSSSSSILFCSLKHCKCQLLYISAFLVDICLNYPTY